MSKATLVLHPILFFLLIICPGCDRDADRLEAMSERVARLRHPPGTEYLATRSNSRPYGNGERHYFFAGQLRRYDCDFAEVRSFYQRTDDQLRLNLVSDTASNIYCELGYLHEWGNLISTLSDTDRDSLYVVYYYIDGPAQRQ